MRILGVALNPSFLLAAAIGGLIGSVAVALLLLAWEAVSGHRSERDPGASTERWALGMA